MKRKISFVTYYILGYVIVVNAQVNLQSGAAQASFPLYSYADVPNRIGISISLNYVSGSGLKVNDLASEVGAGWQLNFGGAVTRIQHGEPDDQKQDLPYNDDFDGFGTGPYTQNYFPNGYLYSEFDPAAPIDNGGGYTRLTSSAAFDFRPRKKYLADREQDEFAFSFNERSGSFVIGRNGEIKTTVNSKLKIEIVNTDMTASNIRTRISEFHVTDENGIKYVFKDLELNELIKYDQIYSANNQMQLFYANSAPSNDWFQNKRVIYGRGMNKFVVSKWHLSEIINPMTNVKIIFNYESYNVDLNASESFQRSSTGTEASKTHSLIWAKIKGKSKRIKSIQCSNKEKVEFRYFDIARADFTSGNALAEIKVKYNNDVKYSWQFSFGYFYYNDILPFEATSFAYDPNVGREVRLCLRSIKRKGKGLNEAPTTFDYNVNLRVPANFSYYHDHWGYTNQYGSWGEGYSFDWALAKQNLAQPLDDPQLYRGVSNNYASAGIIKSMQYSSGGSLIFEYEQNTGLDNGGATVFVGGVRVNKTKQYDGLDHANDIITEYKYVKEDGTSSGWGYEPFVYSRTSPLRIYKSEDDNNKPGINFSLVSSALPSIGTDLMSKASVIKFYTFSELLGSVVSHLAAVIVANYIINILQDVFTPAYKDYTTYEAFSNPLNGNVLPILYSRVEVIPKAGTDNNGKTVYEFTSNSDYPINRPSQSYPYSDAPRYENWKYGLPIKTLVFTKDNILIKKIEQSYTPVSQTITDPNFLSQKWGANRRYFDDQDYTPYETSTGDMAHDFYYPLSGRIQLIQTKEYQYKSANEYAVVTTNYEYSPENYQVNKISTTNSKGEIVEVLTHYPSDYTLSSMVNLKNKNILSVPISVGNFLIKNGYRYQVGGSVNEFGTIPNADIKLLKTYQFQSKTPIDKTGINFNPAILIPDNTNYFEEASILYDQIGASVQTNIKRNYSSTIYTNNGKYVIAQIQNATADKVAYTSFEGEDFGGWTLGSGSTISANSMVTGKLICSGSVSKTVPTGSYIISAWASPNITVNGQTANPLRISKRDGSLGYYEWRLTNVSSIQVAAGSMDEVRLFPVGSQMVTYTHDPLIGISSEGDQSSNITYYEYFYSEKVSIVRNADYNIVKKFCYNSQGQQGLCTIFGNTPQQGSFTKTDCSSGSGTQVTYSVPANSYYGATQTDADALALEAVNSNGPEYANLNGTCAAPQTTINGQSYINTPYTVSFTNTATSQTYNMFLYPNSTSSIAIPIGSYNVSFAPFNGATAVYTYFYVNGYSRNDYTASFLDVNIGSGSTVQIGWQ